MRGGLLRNFVIEDLFETFESLDRREKEPQLRDAIITYHAAGFYSGAINLVNVKYSDKSVRDSSHLEAFKGLVH